MPEAEVDIKIFRAGEVRDWLWHNRKLEGYSNRILSPVRANAILHNPYLQDDDPIAAALYEGETLAAYTAAFPDMLEGRKVWWFSTLWCHRDYRGKGYSLIVVGSLAEEYGNGNFFDMWGAPETVEIFRFLGLKTSYIKEYVLEQKNIVQDKLKGKLMFKLQQWQYLNRLQRTGLKKKIANIQYRIMYVDYLDDQTYAFIQAHAQNDIWLRSQAMMNWIHEYSFKHCSPLYRRDYGTGYFVGKSARYWRSGVKVYVNGKYEGYYYICDSDRGLSIKYLYYNPQFEEQVFASIAEHVIKLGNRKFTTRNARLAEYFKKCQLFEINREEEVSFSYPESFILSLDAIAQGGDGDGFVG